MSVLESEVVSITDPGPSQFLRYRQLVQVLAALASSSHEVEAVVQAVHQQAVHQQAGALFPAQITLLALRQPDGDWLWEVYEDERRYTQRLPFYAEGIIERVLQGDALAIPDIDVYLAEQPVRLRRVMDQGQVLLDHQTDAPFIGPPSRAMLFVPLEVEGKRMGVLSIQSYETHAFDDTDLEFLDLLAQHVSIALENAALREELEHLTRTDVLTGLPNRRAFSHDVAHCLDQARQQDRPLGLVMLDIHEFKRINDRFGHRTGDEVLATVGQVLRQTCSAPDLAFRLSGDEFAMLVWEPETRLADLGARLTQGLRAADWPPGPGPICLQGGWALPPSGMDVNGWLSLADARMYSVKKRRTAGGPVTWGLDFGGDCP